MSYMGLDPAGPFEKCPVCGYDMDYTKSYDHRECIPKIQEVRNNHTCGTCNRMLWDCDCPQWAECVECGFGPEEISGPKCFYAQDGVHRWKVPDGDGVRMLT